MRLAFDRTVCVKTFGRCDNPNYYNDEYGCDGLMVLESDRRLVVRDAIAYDRAGGNVSSEYDL